MTADLTIPEARADRDRLAGRIDVLGKVKALRMLPGDTYVTIEMVGDYFEVRPDTIEWHVRNNRDELASDGLEVLTGLRLSEFKSESGITSRAPSMTLFPRRAILRIGMLLRDSLVARRVRNYLLDAEQQTAPMSRDQLMAAAFMEARTIIAEQTERAEVAEAKVIELEPAALNWQQLVDRKGLFTVQEAANMLCQAGIEIGQNRLFKFLMERGWLNKKRRPYQHIVERGLLESLPQGDPWTDEDGNKHHRMKVFVTAKGLGRLLEMLSAAKQDNLFPSVGA